MTRKAIKDFIVKYNLPNCFGITRDKNGDYIVVNIDDCESGFYRAKTITTIQVYENLQITAPIYERMCDCIIFYYGNIILSKEETWDGWQSDFVIRDYYEVDKNNDPF